MQEDQASCDDARDCRVRIFDSRGSLSRFFGRQPGPACHPYAEALPGPKIPEDAASDWASSTVLNRTATPCLDPVVRLESTWRRRDRPRLTGGAVGRRLVVRFEAFIHSCTARAFSTRASVATHGGGGRAHPIHWHAPHSSEVNCKAGALEPRDWALHTTDSRTIARCDSPRWKHRSPHAQHCSHQRAIPEPGATTGEEHALLDCPDPCAATLSSPPKPSCHLDRLGFMCGGVVRGMSLNSYRYKPVFTSITCIKTDSIR